MLTDRSAYLSFLEVQLERVSAASLTSTAFAERIEQLQAQLLNNDEKSTNVTRLVRLTQQYSEEQAEQATTRFARLEQRLQAFEKLGENDAATGARCARSAGAKAIPRAHRLIAESHITGPLRRVSVGGNARGARRRCGQAES